MSEYRIYDKRSIVVRTKCEPLTEIHTYETDDDVKRGRPKQWTERLTLPLTKETVDRLDAVRGEGEDRLSIIRAGIELELRRRSRDKPKT